MNMMSMHGSTRGTLLAFALGLAGCGEQPPAETTTNDRAVDSDLDATWTTGDTADGTWSVAWRPVGGDPDARCSCRCAPPRPTPSSSARETSP